MTTGTRAGLLLLSCWLGAWACGEPRPVRGAPEEAEPGGVEGRPDPPFEPMPLTLPATVDRGRELLVTDRATLEPRADSARASAPWSFRHLMEALAPPGAAPAFTRAWLRTWQTATLANDDAALILAARADVAKELVCPWLRLTPANQCDETCAACAAEELDMTRAPFRLLAIVNRLDLAETPEGCAPEASEGRFVFVATRPGTEAPVAFNVIFEYAVDGTKAGAPEAWHALGEKDGEAHAGALEALTRTFTDPGKLAQLRTSENLGAARGTSWELRQFARAGARLAPASLTNTVADALDGTEALATHVNAHTAQIFSGDNAVTPELRTAVSTMPRADFTWTARGASPTALRLFGLTTCNGCHSGERGDTSVLPFAHVGVDASGKTILSRFLADTMNPGRDELSFREGSMLRRLEGRCGSPDASYAGRRGGALGGLPVRPPFEGAARRAH